MESLRQSAGAGAPDGVCSVLVADFEAEERSDVVRLFRRAGFRVFEAATGDEALEAARRQRPSAVVLEVALPGLSGYEVCRALRSDDPDIAIVFLSSARTESYDRVAGLIVGADDYLTKPFAPDELLARVRRLVRNSHSPSGKTATLTKREREVLDLLAKGASQKEISTQLFITPKTVGTHIESILKKLGVHSRADAVALAREEARRASLT